MRTTDTHQGDHPCSKPKPPSPASSPSTPAKPPRTTSLPSSRSHFAETFLFAGPSGAQPVRASDFAAALPKRKSLFDQLGSQPTQLTGIHETPLDSRYVLARTTWRFSFTPDNAAPQQFETESTFLIDTGLPGTPESEFKFLLYLPHHDIMQILRDHAILRS